MKPTSFVSIVFASVFVFSAIAADVAAAEPSMLEVLS